MNIWEAGIANYLVRFMQVPTDVENIQKIYNCYAKDEKLVNALEKNLLGNENFKDLYTNWYKPQPYTLNSLLELPNDSFGHRYALHMQKNNLSVDFISDLSEKNIVGYLWIRAQHVHDICHVLTGYDTTFVGELALKGFELAQCHSAATVGILGTGLLSVSALHPELIPIMMEPIFTGYQKGKAFPLMVGIKWDLEWETKLDALIEKFNLPQNTQSYFNK